MKLNLIVLVAALVGSTFALPHTQKVKQTPLGVPYQGDAIQINKKVLSTKKIPFQPHPAGNASWLGMNFDFQYVKPVFDILNSTQVPLLNRGESHITVISPPEFGVLATAGMTIDQVNQIALTEKIQSSKVKIVCLGKEDVNGKIVYQLIVSAPNLVNIREKVFQLFVKQGGNTALFDPSAFWPHITVGFTSGDLFIQDGVYKGANVCYRPISLKSKVK
ncbi:unnamed protein product [Mucor circinelloides]|uniref:Swiss Army Knife 2H phosphoesterase domain-containing protein n=1 Tax=Mucor circinelloides f. circinelloides (strain 1006PhL) TaxID=1220926 RepID=S2JR29_MUCC1|nr:hypothetical protein HMPREF1544_02216 [Mucor circinelloides 1006PhL]